MTTSRSVSRHPMLEAELRRTLIRSRRFEKISRAHRFATSPIRVVFPKLLKLAKMTWETRARTFWGGTMNVILPEVVSMQIWLHGFFEADVCLYMMNSLKEGMTFIDVGGHFGYFTLLGSYLVGGTGKVLSFEPMPATYDQLRKNVARNAPHPNIDAIRSAGYSENTTITFHDFGLEDSAFNSAFGSRKVTSEGAASPLGRAVPVDARKIDDVLENKNIRGVDLIKIDAESSELFVLYGLLQTIRMYKPGIIVEVGDVDGTAPSSSSREIVEWLKEQGYDAYEACGGELVLHEAKERYEYGNLLFLAKRR